MRLIDADKLRINCVCVDRICVDGRTIENAPTVKAIPIEWVKKFRNQFETTDDYYNVIDYMLQLREKENEKDI